jgi:hypothetical protein
MASALEEYTTEELSCASLWAKGLNAKDIYKEIFPVYGGKCLSCKTPHTWVENCHLDGKRFVGNEEVETGCGSG